MNAALMRLRAAFSYIKCVEGRAISYNPQPGDLPGYFYAEKEIKMPRKKSNTGQEAPAHDTGQTAMDTPAPEQDSAVLPDEEDFLVDFSKVVEQMRARQADRDNAEQTDIPAAPGSEDKAANAPASDKAAVKSASEQEKPRRGRTTKDKPIPEAEKPKHKGHPPKSEKSAEDQAKAQRDKVSISEKDKSAPEQLTINGPAVEPAVNPPAAPAVEAPAEPAPPPRPVAEGKVVYLKLSEVHPFHTFRPHPFKVKDDAKMQETVESIKLNGVMVPGLARPEKEGGGYEIIAGHRRCRGSELAGLTEMPFIVRDMSDHEAVQAMKDSNKQRDQTLPSELAALLDLEVEDIKHQGVRLKNVAEGDIGKRSVEIVGEAHGMNYKKVMRYLRLNSLVPELLDMVDDKKMGFMPAVELSYIRQKNQKLISVSIEGEQSSPSVAQAKRLRELDQAGKLTGDVIDGILSEEKKEVDRVIITTDELNKYFGKEVTPRQMKDQIIALLDDWKEKQPPEKKAPEADRG